MKSEDPDLACQRVVEMVTDYLEGALEQDSGAQLEQHLLICDACSTFVDQHRTLTHALSRLVEPSKTTGLDASKSAALAAFRKLRKLEEP
jgi:predicted anti-sigma-YlaC factor YlaD